MSQLMTWHALTWRYGFAFSLGVVPLWIDTDPLCLPPDPSFLLGVGSLPPGDSSGNRLQVGLLPES